MSDLRAPITDPPPVALPATHRPRVGNTEDGFVYFAGSGHVTINLPNSAQRMVVVSYIDLENFRVLFNTEMWFDARFEEIPHP